MPRKTKTPAPVIGSHADILNCAILYKSNQLHDYERDRTQAEALGASVLVDGLGQQIDRLEQELVILRRMYQFETGTEHGL